MSAAILTLLSEERTRNVILSEERTRNVIELACQFGNLWDELKTLDLIWEWGGDYSEEDFEKIWDHAADLDLVNISGQPEVWKHYSSSQWDEPPYDEPDTEGCEEFFQIVRWAIIDAIYEVENE